MRAGYYTALGLTLALVAPPAAAQDMPVIDAVGAYNHAQVMRHRDGGDDKKRAKPPQQANQTESEGHRRFMALSPESRRALLGLKPELDRRTRVDGTASANRWFETQVAEAERRERTKTRR